jgi:hypothetical protein
MAKPQAGGTRSRFEQWLHERADESVLRWLFGAMLAATATVLVLDYAELQARTSDTITPSLAPFDTPKEQLPPARPGEEGPSLPLMKQDAALKARMTFELVGEGKLVATGTIEPGTVKDFAAEIEKRGGYVKTVVLHSPGGSVTDALQMGRLIREKGFATQVDAGRYCASSCPLVFAGGVERRAGAKARIGVHQVSAYARLGEQASLTASASMDSVQRVSAECQRYLRDMGIDLQVWMHAMETPREKLFYFKPEEMLSLKLATAAEGAKPPVAAKARN